MSDLKVHTISSGCGRKVRVYFVECNIVIMARTRCALLLLAVSTEQSLGGMRFINAFYKSKFLICPYPCRGWPAATLTRRARGCSPVKSRVINIYPGRERTAKQYRTVNCTRVTCTVRVFYSFSFFRVFVNFARAIINYRRSRVRTRPATPVIVKIKKKKNDNM